jgi:hypothetical protein
MSFNIIFVKADTDICDPDPCYWGYFKRKERHCICNSCFGVVIIPVRKQMAMKMKQLLFAK